MKRDLRDRGDLEEHPVVRTSKRRQTTKGATTDEESNAERREPTEDEEGTGAPPDGPFEDEPMEFDDSRDEPLQGVTAEDCTAAAH